jgi:hypothetical protein
MIFPKKYRLKDLGIQGLRDLGIEGILSFLIY